MTPHTISTDREAEASMPYREKTNWLTLIAMLVAYSVYFTMVFTRTPMPSLLEMLWLFAQVTVVQAVAVILGNIVLAMRGYTRADERDKAIARRGATIAYYVLMAGMIYVGVVLPFGYEGAILVNAALLALVTAEAIRLVTILVSYRRGWHG